MHALTRTPVLVAALIAALLAYPAAALSDGASVIADYDDNGQIDGCYTLSEYSEALDTAGIDPQYGELADTINDARLSNVVATEGAECGEGVTPRAPGSQDVETGGSGSSSILLIVGAIAVIAGLGAGVLARLRRSHGAAE